MKDNFKLMKVFDCQDMPHDLMERFGEIYECHNGSYNLHRMKAVRLLSCEDRKDFDKLLNQWLIENGADSEEDVLISYGW